VFTPPKLLGPVRTVRSEFAEWDTNQEQWQPPRSSSLVVHRPDGNVEEREDRYANNSVSRTTFTYDQANRLLESIFQSGDGQIGRTVYDYDESGRLVRKISVDGNGGEQASEIYSYDDRGRKTKVQSVPRRENSENCGTMYGVEGAEQSYTAEGVSTITTLYDDRELSSEALFQNDRGAVILRVILTRDTAGRLVREETRSGDEPPFPIAEALEKASEEERAAATAFFEQLFNPQKAIYCTTYSYDDRGRRTTRLMSIAGINETSTTWNYDEHDNPIREIEERTSGELEPDESGNLQRLNEKSFRHEVRYEYKYDSYGNWTERVVSLQYEANPHFQRSTIERRDISYYD
jgi:hypothetical protein